MEVRLVPIASKFDSQRHMTAIRKELIATMSLTIVSSFFIIFQSISIEVYIKLIGPYQAVLDIPSRYTMGLLALYTAFGIASSLAKNYKFGSLTCGILTLIAFLVITAPPARAFENVDDAITVERYINLANLDSASLFGTITTTLLSVETYRFFIEKDIMVKMLNSIPPEMSNSFIALIPGAVTPLSFWVIRHVIGLDSSGFLSTLLISLKGILADNSSSGGLLTAFLTCFFQILRIRGPAVMGPVTRPFWDMSAAENLEALTSGANIHQLPNTFIEQFLQWFIWVGGAGATLSLVVLMMFSKSTCLKSLSRLSFLPGLFNINEPVVFGTPIIMNPISGIPFIMTPLTTTTSSYFLAVANITPMMAARLAFAISAPVAAWMSTNWSFPAIVLAIVNFLIIIAIYYPFSKVYEKQQLDKEAEELAVEQAAKN